MKRAGKVLIGVLSVGALVGTGYAAWTINYGVPAAKTKEVTPQLADVVVIDGDIEVSDIVTPLAFTQDNANLVATFNVKPKGVYLKYGEKYSEGTYAELKVSYSTSATTEDWKNYIVPADYLGEEQANVISHETWLDSQYETNGFPVSFAFKWNTEENKHPDEAFAGNPAGEEAFVNGLNAALADVKFTFRFELAQVPEAPAQPVTNTTYSFNLPNSFSEEGLPYVWTTGLQDSNPTPNPRIKRAKVEYHELVKIVDGKADIKSNVTSFKILQLNAEPESLTTYPDEASLVAVSDDIVIADLEGKTTITITSVDNKVISTSTEAPVDSVVEIDVNYSGATTINEGEALNTDAIVVTKMYKYGEDQIASASEIEVDASALTGESGEKTIVVTLKGTELSDSFKVNYVKAEEPVVAKTYYLVGTFNEWAQKDENYKMSAPEEGEHIAELAGLHLDASAELKVIVESSDSDALTWVGRQGDGQNLVIGAAGTYTVRLFKEGYIDAVCTAQDPIPETYYYLRGVIDGITDWNKETVSDKYKLLTGDENNIAYLKAYHLKKDDNVKVMSLFGDNDTWYPAQGEGWRINSDGYYDIYFNKSKEIWIEATKVEQVVTGVEVALPEGVELAKAGDTYQIEPEVSVNYGSYTGAITYEIVSGEDAATVSENGLVTAKEDVKADTEVKVKVSAGEFSQTIAITVKENYVPFYGTAENPLTVSATLDLAKEIGLQSEEYSTSKAYVKGIVFNKYANKYGKVVYDIAESYSAGNTSNNTTFVELFDLTLDEGIEEPALGDEVIGYGFIENYNGKIELAPYSDEKPLVVSSSHPEYAINVSVVETIEGVETESTKATYSVAEKGLNGSEVFMTVNVADETYEIKNVIGATLQEDGSYKIVVGPENNIKINVGEKSEQQETVGTITFGSGSGNLNVNSKNASGEDDLGNEWVVVTEIKESSFTASTSYSQIGSSKKPATSITFTMSLTQSVNIKSLSAKFGGFGGTAGNITLKVDDEVVGTGSLNESSDVTVNSIKEYEGTTLTISITDIAKGVKAYYISYTY
jgi:hypothetical protein